MNKKTVKDIDLKGKRVFMRVDFNVPMAEGIVTDDKRIKAALPTIKFCLEQGASLLLASHLGRPKGGPDPEFSLRAASEVLAGHLVIPVKIAPGWLGPEVEAMAKELVTLEFSSDHEIIMVSHSSGDLPSDDATQIVDALKEELKFPDTRIYQGVGYRHLLVWRNGPEEAVTIPPHDVLGQNMAPYLNDAADNRVQALIHRPWPIMKQHPVNRRRRQQGEKEANSVWLWGQGRAPKLPRFVDKYGVKGAVICAVDLLRGMGIYAGFEPVLVQGATGYLNTNYRGKADAALQALTRMDFVFLHVEAPDEAGHAGSWKEKIEAIENFDRKVVGTVLEGLGRFDDFRIMVVSDHLTPIPKRTHTGEPTPFAWASKRELNRAGTGAVFSEDSARQSGLLVEQGYL